MFDYDVVIIGGGPAGLAAGLHLGKAAKYKAIILEKESFGGHLLNMESVENYSGSDKQVSGGQLASEMVNQVSDAGVELEQAEVVGIELYSSCRWVRCASGKGYSAAVVIVAGGFGPKKLGVPGEEMLWNKGVFTCAHCEGGLFADRVVAVCSGGDAGVTDALYLAQRAAKVVVIEERTSLNASAALKDKALSNPKLDIRYGVKVESILGDGSVQAIEFVNTASGQKETLKVDGVLINIGLEPNTSYLRDILDLDSHGQIMVNKKNETNIPYILAAGDIRSGSSRQIADAMNDGTVAANHIEDLLQELKK